MYRIYDANGNLDLSILADYCTFLGFLITLATFGYAIFIQRRVKRLSKRILFDNTISQARTDLKKVNSDISTSLNNYTQNIRYIRRDVLLCETILQNVKRQVERDDKKSISDILKLVKKIKHNKFDVEPAPQLNLIKKAINWVIAKEIIDRENIWDLYSRNNALQKRLEYTEKKFKTIDRYV